MMVDHVHRVVCHVYQGSSEYKYYYYFYVKISDLCSSSIYPSAHDNSIQIPLGNISGSLPDLTSKRYPPPLHTPVDQDSSSPYSSVS